MSRVAGGSIDRPAALPWSRLRRSLYAAVFLGLAACLLTWPLQAYDTDLWFHLSGGRQLVETGRLATSSDTFSFVQPVRHWADSSWLHRAVLYLAYRQFGDLGVIGLRAALYLLLIGAILALLRHRPRAGGFGWSDALFAWYVPLVLPRMLLARPHAWTYLGIVTLVHLLEHHPRRLGWVPIVAVAWSNLHGAAFPVMWWILGTYALQTVWDARRTGQWPAIRLAVLLISPLAVLLTPNGPDLLRIPFISTELISQYIGEFAPLDWRMLLSAELKGPTLTHDTFMLVAFVAAVMSMIRAVRHRSLRLSHGLLALGGLVLLSRGLRFRYECALLILPLLMAHPPISWPGLTRMGRAGLAAVAATLAAMGLAGIFHDRPAYPVSPRGLPMGVAAFLEQLPAGARIFNDPYQGGYLRWALTPRHRIFIDLEAPHLFTDEDLLLAVNAFRDPGVLNEVIRRYEPGAIAAPLAEAAFPQLIARHPAYRLVFFDDAAALYLNTRTYHIRDPDWVLDGIDPFALRRQGVDLTDPAWHRLLPHARRLLGVYPQSGMVNHLMAGVYNELGEFDRALPFAQALARSYPESAHGWQQLGHAWEGLGAADRAERAYRRALAKSDAPSDIWLDLGRVAATQGRWQAAWPALRRGIDLFSGWPPADLLDQLGTVAERAGKPDAARTVWRLALWKLEPEQTELRAQLEQRLGSPRGGRLEAGK